MECAAPLSYLVTQAFKPIPDYRFQECRVRPLCHRHGSPANLAGTNNSYQQPLVCDCGNRECDFQAWCLLPGVNCRPVVSDCGSFKQKRGAIGFSLGEHCPDYARHLVGQRNRRHLNALAGGKLRQPRVEAVRLFHPLLQDGMSTLDEELAQISVSAPLGISQCLLAAGGVFLQAPRPTRQQTLGPS
jgi:hypothetical protein